MKSKCCNADIVQRQEDKNSNEYRCCFCRRLVDKPQAPEKFKEVLEEKLYEIVETVEVPCPKEWQTNGRETMSLFDFSCGKEGDDEEGVRLVEKLMTFISSNLEKAREDAIEGAYENGRAEERQRVMQELKELGVYTIYEQALLNKHNALPR